MTLESFTSCIDDRYREALEMIHKGKDIDQAIREAYLYLLAEDGRLEVTSSSDVKRLVNTWLSKQRITKDTKNWKIK